MSLLLLNVQLAVRIATIVTLTVTMINTIYYQFTQESVPPHETDGAARSEEFIRDATHITEHFTETTIRRVCSKIASGTRLAKPRHFLVDHRHKLLYCWIHKSASTSWIAAFSRLANRTKVQEYYREIPAMSAKSREELLNAFDDASYHKFTVVRHPFARLVSAYRDRMEDNSRFTAQAYIYAPSILRMTRPTLRIPRSEMFLNGNKDRLVVVPTFEEFVRWLVSTSTSTYDVHWSRYVDHCSPCEAKFDKIIKLEKLTNYVRNFTQKFGVDVEHLQKSSRGLTTYQTTCRYLSQLTPELKETLYRIYETDFEMFGYSVDEYVECVKEMPLPSI